MYHGKFNSQRFNSVDHPSDIPLRDVLSGETAADGTLSAIIAEDVPAAAAIRAKTAVGIPVAGEAHGEGAFSASSPVLLPFLFVAQRKRRGFNVHPFNTGDREEYIHAPETWAAKIGGNSSAAGAVDGGIRASERLKASRLSMISAFAYTFGAGAVISSSTPILTPTISVATGRAAHHPGFNHAPFNTESDTAYSVKPVTWRADIDGKTPLLRNVMDAGIRGAEVLGASFPRLTEIYPITVPAADAILASSPELLPTVPLGTRKTPHPPGFNHIPFDSFGEAVYSAQPVTWRGDFDGILRRIQNEIDGGAELSEALNGDVFLILNCYVVWTAENGLNGGFDLKPTVYVGQIRIRRRGFNHGILNRNRINLNFRDRYVRTPLTWSTQLDARQAAQIVVKGGELDAERLKAILDCAGFPVAYNHFISAPTLPFIVYMRVTSPNYFADNRVFRHLNRWNIYLCTELKSRATERKLEAVLDEFSIPYEVVDEVYIDDERLYQIIYQFEELEE